MKESRETILVIEDDTALREGLATNFQLNGYNVVTAPDGTQGMRKAFECHPDLIVLDIMLPGSSGLDILMELRERAETVPVLILSALSTLNDKVSGLHLGADDYVTKPFELPELLARVETMLRRWRATRRTTPVIRFGEVVIDPAGRTVQVRGKEVLLSAREFDLLYLLVTSPNRVFTRDEILEKVWGWDFEGTARTVDNFILYLRQKLESRPASPRYLLTVRGVGYKFHPD
ncbi:MAG: response regulator transcription factor [Armatimonadetes bacterium]|nr:response regulator transcription factor [Armatimonadota bacterium]